MFGPNSATLHMTMTCTGVLSQVCTDLTNFGKSAHMVAAPNKVDRNALLMYPLGPLGPGKHDEKGF